MYDLTTIKRQQKANNAADCIEVPLAFLEQFPALKPDKAQKLFNQYLNVVFDTLVTRLPFLNNGETYVSTQDLLHDCKDFKYQGKRYWVWNAFKEIYPFMVVVTPGSNLRATENHFERNTKVRIVSERLLDMMLHERSPETIFNHFFPDDVITSVSPDQLERVEIDLDNLQRFIDCTEFELERVPDDATALREKLRRNHTQATLILKIGQHTFAEHGLAYLPMIPAKSEFGRTYYKGMNIQNVSKQVRSAIIGRHYQYDMNAAVFAIKLYLYGIVQGGDNNLVGTKLATYTRQYLAEKDLIRTRLAKECFEGINISWDAKLKAIKNALTAIGFGARTNSNHVWQVDGVMKGGALSQILISPTVRNHFLQDKWVKEFIAEQQVMEDDILASAEASEDYEAMCAKIKAANGVNGRVTRGGKLAMLYQTWETDVMDEAILVLARYGISPIARIHDAFIVRDKLSPRIMDDINAAWGLRDYLSLDCELFNEWVEASYKRAVANAVQEQAEHKQRIEREEVLSSPQRVVRIDC